MLALRDSLILYHGSFLQCLALEGGETDEEAVTDERAGVRRRCNVGRLVRRHRRSLR